MVNVFGICGRPFWRGETGAAWEFHGSDGSAGASGLSIHLCRCGLAFTVCLGVVTPVASWCSMVQLVTHRMIFEGAMHHMHQGENKRREEHCVVHQTAKKSSPWTQRFAYEDIKRVLERAMISSAVLA